MTSQFSILADHGDRKSPTLYYSRPGLFFQEMFNVTRDNDMRFSIPRIPEEDEDFREDSSTSLARRGFEGQL